MNVLILQPPLMQLNTAYPSGAYLSAFFKSQNCQTKWLDLNIRLFYKIFSKSGLEKLFSLASKNALNIAEKAEKSGDEATAFNLRRYVSEKNLWMSWIDKITAILRGQGFENAHRFCFGAHVPRGNRMENYLSSLENDLTTDDARALASFALADLADFITIAFDKNFSLVRYAESLTISESSFNEIEKGAESPVLKHFYVPLLEKLFLDKNEANCFSNIQNGEKTLVLVSVPFPGTFAAALATGKFFKTHFAEKTYISFGGGFVNTELRETKEPALSKYTDALCFDRGYASYKILLENLESHFEKSETFGKNGDSSQKDSNFPPIYKLRQFSPSKTENSGQKTEITDEANPAKEDLLFEKNTTSTLIPDFSDIDFSLYPRLIDDTNPMHRLWSDGAWIKIYMAHGCYWHKCAFCDVTLDYVCGFQPTNVKKLYEEILMQCEKKNIWGIHFVDEAMPPVLMVQFAKENIKRGSPITWWGNIRFEKYFTRDVADLLAYGGLIGVSAGLESATGNGLNAIHKGTDLDSIVAACCAFKEAGVLVHAYMIYGYWWEKPQDLINSMETLRQFYENGLLDSSFWHKFVLTRHSRVFNEWKQGLIKDLKPIFNETFSEEQVSGKPISEKTVLKDKETPLFAKNGLHFEGEKSSEKYGPSLDYSLDEWMHGRDLKKPVQKWFNFQVPRPTVPPDFIANLIEKYEENRDKRFSSAQNPSESDKSEKSKEKFWLGGEKISVSKGKSLWFYMGEAHEEKDSAAESRFRGKGLCEIE